MIPNQLWSILGAVTLLFSSIVWAADAELVSDEMSLPSPPTVGSWTFSGMVNNESGDRYGYFFQIQRQGTEFETKTALIDGQTNQLVLMYEAKEHIAATNTFNWHVGRSFIRYNPINDSWIFGVKAEDNKGFNFKVDMLKQASKDNEAIELRPGVELQAVQTSSLNGHIQMGEESKEQFVTGNNAWFGKLWVSKEQKSTHEVSTTFCRLSNENGFYSANMKEEDATRAAVTGWRDAAGNQVKMSQFISIKPMANDQCVLKVGLPKLNLKLSNTLVADIKPQPQIKSNSKLTLPMAGFSKSNPKSFCFVSEHSLVKADPVA